MTDLHPVTSTPAPVSRAAAEAIAADQALSQLARASAALSPTPVLVNVLAAGFEAVTRGLLAAAAAIEDSGADTADAVTDLDAQLALVDDTLSAAAQEIAWPRLRARRRNSAATAARQGGAR